MSNNSSTSSATWDLGRFVKTLSYFGAIPVLSSIDWLQHMLGSRPNPSIDGLSVATPKPIVLWIGFEETMYQSLLPKCIEQGYSVCVLVENAAQAKLALGSAIAEQIKFIETDAEALNTLVAEGLRNVTAIFCSPNGLSLLRPIISWVQQGAIATRLLFDFAHPSVDLNETWGALDDVVMGGVSRSAIQVIPGKAVFAGQVSTANSGGFASVRTRNFDPPIDLSPYEGIALRVRGDGQRYKFMVRCETRWDGIAYCYSFDTTPDQWLTVRIPFNQLVPVFRAKTVPDAGALNTQQVTAFQLMLSKFEYDGALNPHFRAGAFQLDLESIGVYNSQSNPELFLLSDLKANPTAIQRLEQELRQSQLSYTVLAMTDPTVMWNHLNKVLTA